MISGPALALRGGLAAVLLLAVATPAVARALPADSTRLTLDAGAAFDAHTDLLASPFRQTGAGFALGIGLARGRLSVDLSGASVGTSSSLTTEDVGVEDGWSLGLDFAWLVPVRDGGATAIRLGGGVSGLAFVRRHHYGRAASREYFADLIVPLSAVGEARRAVGGTELEERVAVGLAALFFRSPYAATKTFPPGSFAAPGTLWLVRHRLRASWRTSARTRLLLTHEATFYDTNRRRLARVLQQRVSAGLALKVGGAR